MKLLTKEETSSLKSLERKREIDEGMKLANKVDKLRELSATEQANIIKFRNESLKKVQLEIDNLIDIRDGIRKDNKDLEVINAKARIPLDGEWSKLKLEQQSLKDSIEINNQVILSIKQREMAVIEREYAIGLDEERVLDLKDRTIRLHNEADNRLIEADSIHTNAMRFNDALIEGAKNSAASLDRREASILSKEIDLDNRKVLLDSKDKSLSEKDRALNDKYDTLQRTIKRKTK